LYTLATTRHDSSAATGAATGAARVTQPTPHPVSVMSSLLGLRSARVRTGTGTHTRRPHRFAAPVLAAAAAVSALTTPGTPAYAFPPAVLRAVQAYRTAMQPADDAADATRRYSPVAVLLDHRRDLSLTAGQATRLDSLDRALADRNRSLVLQIEANRGHRMRLRGAATAMQRNARDAVAAADAVLTDGQRAQAEPLLAAWRDQVRAYILGDAR
jgi:hypothetical protein